MVRTNFTESVVEHAALAWLKPLGYAVRHGPEIVAGQPAAERGDPSVATSFWKAACGPRSPGLVRHFCRRARRRIPQAHAPFCAFAPRAQPRRASDAGGWRAGGIPPCQRLDRCRSCARDRFRQSRQQRAILSNIYQCVTSPSSAKYHGPLTASPPSPSRRWSTLATVLLTLQTD